MRNELAREEARKLWNAHPCGGFKTSAHDREYFDRVEAERYEQQYWQREFFDFGAFAGKRVLEIGVGHGTDLKQFARAGADCHGIDLADTHLRLAALNFEHEGLPVSLQKADAAALPFPDASFDVVYSFGVLHIIPDVDRALSEIRRVLKPGGVLLTAVYHLWSIHTAVLFGQAAKRGTLFRKGIAGTLATIERGADGVNVKPFCRLYSLWGWNRLLRRHGFAPTKAEIHQVYDPGTPLIRHFRRFDRLLGWYVAGVYRR